MAHVFLSYSRTDIDIARKLLSALAQAGIETWTDANIEPGTPVWQRAIEDAIRQSDALVCILSPDAAQSNWVRAELDFARMHNKTIFPILARGDQSSSIPLSLATAQWIDIRTNYALGVASVVSALSSSSEENENARRLRSLVMIAVAEHQNGGALERLQSTDLELIFEHRDQLALDTVSLKVVFESLNARGHLAVDWIRAIPDLSITILSELVEEEPRIIGWVCRSLHASEVGDLALPLWRAIAASSDLSDNAHELVVNALLDLNETSDAMALFQQWIMAHGCNNHSIETIARRLAYTGDDVQHSLIQLVETGKHFKHFKCQCILARMLRALDTPYGARASKFLEDNIQRCNEVMYTSFHDWDCPAGGKHDFSYMGDEGTEVVANERLWVTVWRCRKCGLSHKIYGE